MKSTMIKIIYMSDVQILVECYLCNITSKDERFTSSFYTSILDDTECLEEGSGTSLERLPMLSQKAVKE